MKLSVVILNYNVRYFLELCVKSVQAAILKIDAEIIVVDNNSDDGSCNMVKQLFPNIKLIENKENFGFSKGNNIGVSHAKGEYLCILNPDTVVSEDTFIKLIEFSENKQKLGIVGCKLIDGVGSFLPESKRNIPLVMVALKKLLGNSKYYYANHLKENDTGKVDVLVGAFMFLKRDVYNKVCGFDEDYFMYGEDIDLSYRVLKSGFVNYYFGATVVLHYKGESTLRDKFYAKRFYGAMQIFYKKHFKKNRIFDLLVNSGIKIGYILKKTDIAKQKNVSEYIIISKERNERLNSVLNGQVTLKSEFKNLKNKAEVIFDAKTLSYKSIILLMDKEDKDKLLTYKILPGQSNFVIGSDNSISRGEVLNLD